ncbi:MAG: NnrS family protein [Terriglobia bacterium]
MTSAESVSGRERKLQTLVTAYILTGLFFLLLPGTFLGVWNLISISNRQALDRLSPAWLQAHGHAQIFGWIGTFILGIGFYSLSKMGGRAHFAIAHGWTCLALWTLGLLLRWSSTTTEWHWRILIPLASMLELGAFIIFFRVVSRHRPPRNSGEQKRKPEAWMRLVIASTVGFLLTLIANVALTSFFALRADGPALPHGIDQQVLILAIWGFLVPAVWGFNARWLPVFLGLQAPRAGGLFAALGLAWAIVISALTGYLAISVALMPIAAAVAIEALHIWEPSIRPPKTEGIHPAFPVFVRGAYVWLAIASVLSICAFTWDRHGGIWGASRHALTVGFLSTMVFAIGQRVLPAFCGMKVLFSKRLMLWSLLLLNLGCVIRVAAEIPAYEGIIHHAWYCLPVSGVIELIAVTLFAVNLLMTFLQPAAHLRRFGNDRAIGYKVRGGRGFPPSLLSSS